MGFDELSTRLWRVRSVLERLGFKLAEEHLILASGCHSWLDRATAEVEEVVEELAVADADRAQAVADLSYQLGLRAVPTLAELADSAPEPWADLLVGHRLALLEHFAQIERVSSANRAILARRLAATTDALNYLGVRPGVAYGANGTAPHLRADSRLVNATA